MLSNAFGSITRMTATPSIDARAVVAESHAMPVDTVRTLRKSIQEVSPDGQLRSMPQREEYTVFEESTYVCSHVYTNDNGVKKADVFIWKGDDASEAAAEQAQIVARRVSKEVGGPAPRIIEQGHETPDFLQAVGGILVTRRGSKQSAPKQYMLCGRKHLGHITFDEVDFAVTSLCSGFVYLISYPVTLQQTKLYLWKGSACSTEEISAARLAAMDLSETGDIIEVSDGAEFASFLKVFGAGTTKADVPKPSRLWQQKLQRPDDFAVRLYKIQQVESRPGFFGSMFIRRPSWNSRPPSRSPSRDGEVIKVEAKHISPFVQADFEAEGLYVFDAGAELYLLLGPLFASQVESVRDALFAQALLFANEYLVVRKEQHEASELLANIVFSGVPSEVKMLVRHWDDGQGLWGTAGLMAGSRGGTEVVVLPLQEAIDAVIEDS